MPPRALMTGEGSVIIPLNLYRPNIKVEIDNVDVTDDLISGDVTLATIEEIGGCNIIFDNRDGQYTRYFTAGDIIKVYADFSNATTQIFEGRVNEWNYELDSSRGFTLEIVGRDYGEDAVEITVTEDYSGNPTDIGAIMRTLIGYLSDLGHTATIANVPNIGINATPIWNHISVLVAIKDLMDETGNAYGFRYDFNKAWYLFQLGSLIEQSEAAIYQDNLIGMRVNNNFTPLKNILYTYGREIEGIPTVYKKTSTALIFGSLKKEAVIQNDNLINMTAVRAKANADITTLETLEQSGEVTTIGMPNLKPGYKFTILNPYCDVMGLRLAKSVNHILDGTSGFRTTVTFAEIEKGLVSILEERKKRELELVAPKNPYKFEDAYIIKFIGEDTSDLQTLFDTIVWDDHLMLQLTKSYGYAITKTYTASKNITQVMVKIAGQNFASDEGTEWVKLYVSNDGGNTYKEIIRDTVVTLDSEGRNMRMKIEFISLTTKIRAIGLLMK